MAFSFKNYSRLLWVNRNFMKSFFEISVKFSEILLNENVEGRDLRLRLTDIFLEKWYCLGP